MSPRKMRLLGDRAVSKPPPSLEELVAKLVRMVDDSKRAARTAKTPDLGLIGKPGFERLVEQMRSGTPSVAARKLAAKVLDVEDRLLEPGAADQGDVEVPGSVWKELVDLARRSPR